MYSKSNSDTYQRIYIDSARGNILSLISVFWWFWTLWKTEKYRLFVSWFNVWIYGLFVDYQTLLYGMEWSAFDEGKCTKIPEAF